MAMKTLLILVLSIGMSVAMVGCSDGKPGGPGVSGGTTTDRSDSFALDVPAMNPTVNPGGSQDFKVAVNRGSDMDQQITLKFSNLPPGVTVSPPVPSIAPGNDEANLTLIAAPDAAPGKFTVTVVGQ